MGRFKAHGRTQQRIPKNEHAIDTPFIQVWLQEPGRLVTRQELYEFISRLEHGRARANTLPRRMGWVLTKFWRWLKQPIVENEVPSNPS